MAYDIGPRIGIEGEREYREALNRINQRMKTLGTEMAAVTSAFDKNDRSIEALTAQNSVLNKQIETQKEKLAELKKGLEAAREKYGENSEVTQKWQQAVNNATAELNGLERRLRENTAEMSGAAKETGEAAEKMRDLAAGEEEAAGRAGRLASAMGGVSSVMAKGVAAAAKTTALAVAAVGTAAVAAAKQVFELTRSAGDFADELLTTSAQTGVSAKTLQEWDYAARFIDTDVETMTGSMARLVKSMAEAKESGGSAASSLKRIPPGAKDVEAATLKVAAAQEKLAELQKSGKASSSQLLNAQAALAAAENKLAKVKEGKVVGDAGKEATGAAKAFETLGVKITDSQGNLRDNKEVFADVIDALGKVSNETERDALSMEIFGKSARDLNPLIKAGGAELKRLGREAENMGLVLDDEAVKALGSFDDTMERIDAQTQALGRSLAVIFLPAVSSVMKGVQDVLGGIGAALKNGFQPEDISAIGGVISKKLIGGLNDMAKYIPDVVSTVSEMLTHVVSLIVALLPPLLPPLMDGATQLLTGLLDAIVQNAQPLVDTAVVLVTKFAGFMLDALPKLFAAASQIITALAAGITSALPELVPAAVNTILTLYQGLVDNLPLLIDTAIRLVLALVKGLLEALPSIYEKAPEILRALINGIVDAIPQLVDAAIQITLALIDFLTDPDNLATLVGASIEIVLAIVAGLIKAVPRLIEGVLELINTVRETIANINWVEVGGSIIAGIVNGIKNGIGNIAKAAKEAASSALGAMKNLLGIHSPSSVMRGQIGLQIGAGVAEGIEDSRKRLRAAMAGLNRELVLTPADGGTLGGFRGAVAASAAPVIVNVNEVMELDGKIVARSASRTQYCNNRTRRRALGVIPT